MANVLNTTVGDARNTEASGEGADTVDGGSLGATNGHNLLGDAGRAATHADTETVDTSSDERSGLLTSHDVSANDIEARVVLLDPLDHLDLVHAVTLGAVEDDNIQTSIDEELQSLLVLGAGTNGGSAEELLAIGELGGEGKVLVLGQVGAGDHGNEVAALVDDGELALLGLGEDAVGLEEVNAVRGSGQVGDHDVGDRGFVIFLELDVAVGNNTQQLGAKLAILCNLLAAVQYRKYAQTESVVKQLFHRICFLPMTEVYTVERKLYCTGCIIT